MKKLSHKFFLFIGIAGLITGIAGNIMKKTSTPFATPIHIIGIAGLAVFWIYSIWDVLKCKFWTGDTKLKYSAIVILLPIIGPFIFYYYRKEVVGYDDKNYS